MCRMPVEHLGMSDDMGVYRRHWNANALQFKEKPVFPQSDTAPKPNRQLELFPASGRPRLLRRA